MSHTGRSFFWLALGFVLMLFSNGRWIVPAAAWLAPLFILRFMHSQRPFSGLSLALLVSVLAYVIAWRGLIPLSGVYYYLVAGGLGLVFWLPYLSDRLLTPRFEGVTGTLVFPLTWTALEYLYTETNPFASWGSIAYTQYGNLPLVQVVSVTGIWGLTFLITWFASVANWVWKREFAWSKVRWGVAPYAFVLASVLLFGGLRLALVEATDDVVRIGSVVSSPKTQGASDSVVLESYLSRTRDQARAGAAMVVWDEGGIPVSRQSESLVVARGRQLARAEGIYLLMGLAVRGGKGGLGANKATWINPSGDVVFEHEKHLLMPGERFAAGDRDLQVDDTPYGRITAAICMDLDRPSYIRRPAGSRADILLAPSFDWKEIDPIHTHMASFRAIENGFSLVRATCEGLSAGFDHHGRALSATDYFTSDAAPLVCYVPIRGVATVYSVVGDAFAWLCVLGSLAMAGWVVVAPSKTRKGEA